jgi:hypothetical protein
MFSSIQEARDKASGTVPSLDLNEYYGAWQFLYDCNATLNTSDHYYMQKLISDGNVLTPGNSEELNGNPVRELSSRSAYLLTEDYT